MIDEVKEAALVRGDLRKRVPKSKRSENRDWELAYSGSVRIGFKYAEGKTKGRSTDDKERDQT